jgi:3-hydroxyacyl-[acyl-carrier-protein] dehydratase
MSSEALTPSEVLARLPQREPFRFVDRILEIDAEHVVAEYCWRSDADFYRGHFPGRPVTPGVLLLECMAQAGVAALGIYLQAGEIRPSTGSGPSTSSGRAEEALTVFTDAKVEFLRMVEPGSTVIVTGRKLFFRRGLLRADVEMRLAGGDVVCSGTLTGAMVVQ